MSARAWILGGATVLVVGALGFLALEVRRGPVAASAAEAAEDPDPERPATPTAPRPVAPRLEGRDSSPPPASMPGANRLPREGSMGPRGEGSMGPRGDGSGGWRAGGGPNRMRGGGGGGGMDAMREPGGFGPADPRADEARRLFDSQDHEGARKLALEILAVDPGHVRMRRIVVSSACILDDEAQAREFARSLTGKDLADMRKRCERYGIQLTASP